MQGKNVFCDVFAQFLYRFVLRECMDPYLARKKISFSTFFRQHESFLLGFYFPFMWLTNTVPYLQPLVFIFATCACGQLAPQIDSLMERRMQAKLKS